MSDPHPSRTFAGVIATLVAGVFLVLAVLFLIPLVRGTGDTATWFAVAVVVVGGALGAALARLAASLLCS
jgi:predicted membrane protein